MGGYQTALKQHWMKILFRGQPLENAPLTVMTTSGWKKTYRSDAQGLVVISPPETLAKPGQAKHHPGPKPADGTPPSTTSAAAVAARNDRYLYTVTHREPETGGYYVSSLTMTVNRSQPEWLSSSRGFAIWAMVGMGLGIVTAIGGFYYQKKRKQATILALTTPMPPDHKKSSRR